MNMERGVSVRTGRCCEGMSEWVGVESWACGWREGKQCKLYSPNLPTGVRRLPALGGASLCMPAPGPAAAGAGRLAGVCMQEADVTQDVSAPSMTKQYTRS